MSKRAVNKVIVGGETKLDLTQDTVTPQTMLAGATAHNAAGEQIEGAVAVAPASDTTPSAPADAGSVGTEEAYARGDHIHPKDATKQDKITASGILKGNGLGGVAAATRGSDYIASGNIVKQTLVASETTPTENYAINWVYG